jgi:hypothetical protein
MKTLISIAICGLILAGCAAKPLTTGDSTVQLKTASFPKQGQQAHTVVGGLVHLKAHYQSGFTFRLVNPLSMGFYLGKVIVATKDEMTQSVLDGEVVFCTRSKAYIDPMTGPHAVACFQSADKGKFNSIKAAPGSLWFNKQLLPPIDYVSSETAFSMGGKPLKRELIFEGGENGTLMFSEKIYENSVEIASRSKPLMFKVESIPSKAILNGAEITIINYTNNTLTYSLEKAWN